MPFYPHFPFLPHYIQTLDNLFIVTQASPPYLCEFCQKGFPSSSAMKKHRRSHTGERPYECKRYVSSCSKRFKNAFNRIT